MAKGDPVFADGRQVPTTQSGGKTKAIDPCVTSTPSGAPVVIPYPNTASSSDLSRTTSSVWVGGAIPATAADNLTTSHGGEPGNLGGVKSKTSNSTAKAVSYSFSVKFGGNAVVRDSDIMVQNSSNTFGIMSQTHDTNRQENQDKAAEPESSPIPQVNRTQATPLNSGPSISISGNNLNGASSPLTPDSHFIQSASQTQHQAGATQANQPTQPVQPAQPAQPAPAANRQWKGWTNLKSEKTHFKKHGKEFNCQTVGDYRQLAEQFWQKPLSVDVLEKVGNLGRIYRYEISTGILSVADTSDPHECLVITLFKPRFLESNRLTKALAYYNNNC